MLGRKSPLLWGIVLVTPSCRYGYEVLGHLGLETEPPGAEDPGDGDEPSLGGAVLPGGAPGAPGSGGAPSAAGGAPDPTGGAPGAAGDATALGGSAGAPYMGPTPDPDPPPVLSAGQSHTCGVSSLGTLVCWGGNTGSALGAFVGASSADPVPVGGEGDLGGFVGVAAGRNSTCALRDDGSVYCWGSNIDGQLGQGDTIDRDTPVRVPLARAARTVTLNFTVACAIDDVGDLYCWGWNDEGQLGQGDSVASPVDGASPLPIPSAIPWADVSAGDGHVCAIRVDGALYCWGRNSSGELGRDAPIQLRTPTRVGADSDFKLVRASQSQTCAIRQDKSLWCWGAGDQGQLGIEPPEVRKTPSRVGTESDWVSVEPQTLHGCGLREDGSIWCWGRRQEGQLVVGYDPNPVLSPIQIDPEPNWDLISAGRFHTCGRRSGVLHCTGENENGRLGDGTFSRSYGFVPVQAF